MDDISELTKICDALLCIAPVYTHRSTSDHTPHLVNSSVNEDIHTINRIDIENLVSYVQIWTDIIDISEVFAQFMKSEFTELTIFEKINNLYNVGFFYVKINPKLSPLEFFGLLHKIPWETLRLPGLNQISFAQLIQIFGFSEIAIQIMVLGDFFKFWSLINPYQMNRTTEFTKLLLSGMGCLSIIISPNFLKNCKEMIESVDLESSPNNE